MSSCLEPFEFVYMYFIIICKHISVGRYVASVYPSPAVMLANMVTRRNSGGRLIQSSLIKA